MRRLNSPDSPTPRIVSLILVDRSGMTLGVTMPWPAPGVYKLPIVPKVSWHHCESESDFMEVTIRTFIRSERRSDGIYIYREDF